MQPEPIMPFHLKQILSIMGSKIFTLDFKIFYLLFFQLGIGLAYLLSQLLLLALVYCWIIFILGLLKGITLYALL